MFTIPRFAVLCVVGGELSVVECVVFILMREVVTLEFQDKNDTAKISVLQGRDHRA